MQYTQRHHPSRGIPVVHGLHQEVPEEMGRPYRNNMTTLEITRRRKHNAAECSSSLHLGYEMKSASLKRFKEW